MLSQNPVVLSLAGLVHLALGSHVLFAPPVSPVSPTPHANQTLSADEIHANILRTWPADRIIHSDSLSNYAALHADAVVNTTVYLADEQAFVTIEVVDSLTSPFHELDECINRPTQRKVLRTQTFWDPWVPVSNTVKTGKDDSGGYVTFEFSITKGSSTDLGLALGPFAEIIGGSLGISLSVDYTYGSTVACNVPGNSIGQVWGRHWMAWAEVQQKSCNTCYGCVVQTGYALMPQDDYKNGEDFGCSAGYENVLDPPNPPI